MTADTQIIPTQPPSRSSGFTLSPEASALAVEVAKMLKLVAPASMAADAQLSWIASAVDALEDIRAAEVKAASAEIRRSVTRPAQIVPEIARLVSERRKRLAQSSEPTNAAAARERSIEEESRERYAKAVTRDEIEAAWSWEREARKAAGLAVHPLAPPLTCSELDRMPAGMIALGLRLGHLTERDGKLCETNKL